MEQSEKDAIAERYCFYRLAEKDFLQARHALDLSIKHGPEVGYFLVRDAVISYCRPFTNCHGNIGRHRLGNEVVPAEQLPLHLRLIEFRDKAFAHTDLKAYAPKLARWAIGERKLSPAMGFRNISAEALFSEVPAIITLARSVHSHVEQLMREIDCGPDFMRSYVIGQDP